MPDRLTKRKEPLTDVDMRVAERVRYRRSMLGLTLVQVSADLGVSWQQLVKYEQGKNRISASRLYVLACSLGVPMKYFFAGLRLDRTRDADPSAQEWEALVPACRRERERVRKLISSYWRIKNPATRKRVLDLLHALAE